MEWMEMDGMDWIAYRLFDSINCECEVDNKGRKEIRRFTSLTTHLLLLLEKNKQ
jgi:hypothetical protein